MIGYVVGTIFVDDFGGRMTVVGILLVRDIPAGSGRVVDPKRLRRAGLEGTEGREGFPRIVITGEL